MATTGVKEVCEYGWPRTLEGEIKQQVNTASSFVTCLRISPMKTNRSDLDILINCVAVCFAGKKQLEVKSEISQTLTIKRMHVSCYVDRKGKVQTTIQRGHGVKCSVCIQNQNLCLKPTTVPFTRRVIVEHLLTPW